ncbi:MAG: 4-alpha-glucanotransferase, partial [Polyangiales bacterium]
MHERTELHALAQSCGIGRFYAGYDGGQRVVGDATLEALLAALGLDASTEARASESREALVRAEIEPGMAAVRVARVGAPDLALVQVRLPEGAHGPWQYALELTLEDGVRREASGELSAEANMVSLPLPAATEVSFGYHALRCSLEQGGQSFCFTQDLIVAPPSCVRVSELIGERRAVGLWAHLYSLHSERSAGVGDLSDLREVLSWAADQGIELFGINPLHATDGDSREVSPYYPLSRLYRDPIYLDVDASLARAGVGALAVPGERSALNASARVDYPSVRTYKRRALEVAHAVFAQIHRGKGTQLGRAYAAYRSRQGEPLRHFATFCALREQLCA